MDFIIDGNAFLHVAIGVSKSMVFKDRSLGNTYYVEDLFNEGKFILKDPVRIQFRDFCITYLNSMLWPISNRIDNVHMVFDTRSWRKDYINQFFEEQPFSSSLAPDDYTYKGNRTKDEAIHLFFDYFHDVIIPVLIKRTGINYYRIPGTEGDDMITFLVEKLKCNCLIYTVDGDMRQLTHSANNNRLFMFPKQRTPSKRIYRAEKFIEIVSESTDELDDFFSMDNDELTGGELESVIETLVGRSHTENIVDPVTELFTKIFRGDPKDNISKMTKMTPIKTGKLIASIKESYGDKSIDLITDWDKDFVEFLLESISTLHKLKDTDVDMKNDIVTHMKLNTKLIRLNTKLFPKKLVQEIESDFNSRNITKFNQKNLDILKNNTHII
tara:strand:- start:1171 stop:2322 length:1152 start_codon:yes stop_codon:yes gene_type:complete